MNIQGTTRLIALLGEPIKHSKSPFMHNISFEKTNQDYVYLCLEVSKKDLKQAVDSLKLFDAKGANITYPHKQEILKYIDDISEDASMIGSVNTIVIDENKKIKGYNTDGMGFIKSLEEYNLDVENKKVIVLGSGGAGRAIAINLARNKVKELILTEINLDLANDVKNIIEKNIPDCVVKVMYDDENKIKKELEDTYLLVNATPIGMSPNNDDCIFKTESIFDNTKAFIYDIVYSPRNTKLMQYAKKNNLRNTNGLGMMIWQGALSFKIWLGVDMPYEFVKEQFSKED